MLIRSPVHLSVLFAALATVAILVGCGEAGEEDLEEALPTRTPVVISGFPVPVPVGASATKGGPFPADDPALTILRGDSVVTIDRSGVVTAKVAAEDEADFEPTVAALRWMEASLAATPVEQEPPTDFPPPGMGITPPEPGATWPPFKIGDLEITGIPADAHVGTAIVDGADGSWVDPAASPMGIFRGGSYIYFNQTDVTSYTIEPEDEPDFIPLLNQLLQVFAASQ